jgi:hypothetical protein
MTRFERDALPCPFCGGRAKQVPGECILVCTGCYAKVIDSRWNLRDTFPQPPSDQGLREIIERFIKEYIVCPDDDAVVCPVLEGERSRMKEELDRIDTPLASKKGGEE